MNVDRLAAVAAQLAARVRDDEPEANARWLHSVTTAEEREALLYVLAAAVPDDRTWSQLVAWTDGLENAPVHLQAVRTTADGEVRLVGRCMLCGQPFHGAAQRRYCTSRCKRRAEWRREKVA